MKRLYILSTVVILALVAMLLPSPGREAEAQQEKFLGNLHYEGETPMNFAQYWNQVTPENGGKWASCEQNRDDMNYWGWLDAAYDYAQDNGFPFKEHTLVWGHSSGQPDWICSLSQSEQLAEVEEWIQAVGERYPDIDYVDVVNEPLHDPPCYVDALGGQGETGWDWVINSFEIARQYIDGDLLLNDYGILNSTSSTSEYLDLIILLQDRGLIDGIGVEAHGLESTPSSTLQANLDTLAQTGLPIYVSEYDVDRADDTQQLEIYREQFPIFWEHPAVQGVTLWGYVEGEIWKTNAYLLRSDGTERPALQWLMEYVYGGATPTPTSPPTATPTQGPTPTEGPTATPTEPPTATPTPSGATCEVDYTVSNDWGSGATISVDVINNAGTAIDGWTLEWTFPGDQEITNLWGGSYTQNGADVDVENGSWNATIPANGGSVNVGFNIVYGGSNEVPGQFVLNGVVCGDEPVPSPTPTPTESPTATPTLPPTATPTAPPTATPTEGPTATPTEPPTATPTPSGAACEVDYTIGNDWGSGATISVDVVNNDSVAIDGWTLEWTFPGDQEITNLWGGIYTQSGASAAVSNLSWNSTIPANGGSVNFGFNVTYSGSNEVPTDFTLNGVACQ